ncbi:MAG: hypothetical protein ACI39R_00515 [Lachnospiraceae bacterium]
MINKLERKYGKYAIHNLMKYVVMLYIMGFVVYMISYSRGVDIYSLYFAFDIDKILHGQIWRLVTFLIQPLDTNIFFMLISVYLYYVIGNSLENAWGSFRFNMFYFSGVIFNILAAVIIYIFFLVISGGLIHFSYPISLHYINLSMFLAFGTVYGDARVLLYFIIPIKVKYLAWIYVIIELYGVVSSFISYGKIIGICNLIMLVVSLLNFLIFFMGMLKRSGRGPKAVKRRRDFERAYQNGVNEAAYRSTVTRGENGRSHAVITRHKCAVCGRTELDDDDLEFRFCSKCEGNYEYCMDHLYTHTHVVREYKNDNRGD